MQRRWPILLPPFLVLLIYLPALRYSLVWDDTTFLQALPSYRDPALCWKALHSNFALSPNYFRPLGLISFIIEISVAGLDARSFHLTNLLLHASNTALVAALANRLWVPRDSADGWRAAAAGLLYGLHPGLVEGVAFISSRFDLLLTSALLVALWADRALVSRWRRAAVVGGAFFLGALAKEMAASFFLVLPMWHLACEHRREVRWWKVLCRRENLTVYAAVILAGIQILVLRRLSLGYFIFPGSVPSIPAGTPLQHILLVARSLTAFATLIVWPFTTLSPIHYSTLPVPISEPRNWLMVGAAVGGLLSLAWGLWHRSRAALLAMAGLLSLLPVLNLRPLELGGGAFVAERFLLFPLALLVLSAIDALASFVPTGVSRKVLLGWLAGSVATVQLTLPHWRDSLALWTWGAERAPLSVTPMTNLALEAVNQGHFEEALRYGLRAIELKPDHGNAWNTTGVALQMLGRYPEAQQHFEKATSLEPHVALNWSNLSGALREQGKLEQAEQVLLEQTLRLDPDFPMGHLNLGLLKIRADRPDLAEKPLQRALQLLPPAQKHEAQELLGMIHQPVPWLRFADRLLSQGNIAGTIQATDQAQAFGASLADVASLRSSVLIQQRDWRGAEALLMETLQKEPRDARLVNNLGVVAREWGAKEQARELFQTAAELAPKWNVPRQNLETMK